MKAVVVIYNKELDPEVESLLRGVGVDIYTKFEGAIGKYLSRDLEQTDNNVCLAVLPSEKAKELFDEIEGFRKNKLRKNFGVSVFLVPIETMV
jgi:hypothetical protein